jgi:cytochrome c-type biogenesis protein CcmH/NrfF
VPEKVDAVDNDTFLLWGMLVSLFLVIAFLLTLRQIFENYMADRAEKLEQEQKAREIAESNSGL